MSKNQLTVRECSAQLIQDIESGILGDALEQRITETMEGLIARDDLLVLGVERSANHAPWSSYLYYDGELALHVNHLLKGQPLPVHDHGIWEAIALYRGGLRHKEYHRSDPQDVPGRARLELLEDRRMGMGEVKVVTPPDDIHSLEALEDDTYIITVQLNKFKKNRMYYQPEAGTYVVRDQSAWRGRQ